ncbi:unnamed protein product [Heterobilharzia americana]|nr:unnamed protein product [Heterobilharzia americana]CAH8287275.1 unnamed protein product [Heterobilharzia americana]
MISIPYSHAIRCVDANKELSAKLNTTANYLDRLTPMNILNEKLHISCTESLDNQIGWLVPGFLARITDGRYACSVFWRPLKDNRNNHHNNNLLS